MQITLQLAEDVARALEHGATADASVQPLTRLASELGIALRPLHPGARDAALRSYFVAEIPDPSAIESALQRLRTSSGVLAAYVKPADAMP